MKTKNNIIESVFVLVMVFTWFVIQFYLLCVMRGKSIFYYLILYLTCVASGVFCVFEIRNIVLQVKRKRKKIKVRL